MQYLWPLFIFGAAVGLYEFHLFEMAHPKFPLTLAITLALIAGIFFRNHGILGLGVVYCCGGLIAIGDWLVAGRKTRW